MTSLALLPISAITSIGGLAGLKLAIAMKLLGHARLVQSGPLRSRYPSRHRKQQAARPSRAARRAKRHLPRPHGIPYRLLRCRTLSRGSMQKPLPVRLSVKDFKMLAKATTDFDSPNVKFLSSGSAYVKGNKGSVLQASSDLKNSLVNHGRTTRCNYSSE
ncbi:hypothetical protein MRX96_054844 [Rhipicephalus microplus]